MSKTIIISDTHLDRRFEDTKFKFLLSVLQDCDNVIINGDFWDNWFITFDEFLKTKWSGLFNILLEKKAIYIFGDHDPESNDYSAIGKFCIQEASEYKLESGENEFYIQHGHILLQNKKSTIIRLYLSPLKLMRREITRRRYFKLLNYIQKVSYKIIGERFNSLFGSGGEINQLMKLRRDKVMSPDNFIICGDSHYPELSMKEKYANTGYVLNGYASYISVVDGEIELHYDRY